jgi:hypothetical protein
VIKEKYAMKKQFIGKFCVVIIFLIVCGCNTAPPAPPPQPRIVEVPVPVIDTRIPLSKSAWDRLSKGMDFDIKKLQFVLSGRITLEREYIEQSSSSVKAGRNVLEIVHARDEIIIPDQAEGQVLVYKETGREIILNVCFEMGNDHTLEFSCTESGASGVFYLKIAPEGIIEYGGQRYKVKYNGDTPILFIKVSQHDRDKLNTRVLEGRKVE